MNIFSGLYKFAHGELSILLITCPPVQNGSVEDATGTYTGLEIDEDGTGNVVLVVGLVEKHVFAVAAFGCPFFEDTLLVDPVFGAESLPVYGTHFEARSASR